MRRFLTILLCFIYISQGVLAQGSASDGKGGVYTFSYLGPEKGLSNSSVTCAFQDHLGFMWFGTYDGLNRYDGYGFKVFRNAYEDSASLIPARIVAIDEDRAGRLWIGTKQGVSIYDLATSRFSAFTYRDYASGQQKRVTVPVNDIRTNDKGTVFIGTAGLGLVIADGSHTTQAVLEFQGTHNAGFHAQGVAIDPGGRVWVFVQSVGLCRYESGTVRLVNGSQNVASCMAADSAGHLWIGSDRGLFEYDLLSEKYIRYYGSGELGSNTVTHLYVGARGNLWVSTDGGGVTIIHTATGIPDAPLSASINRSLASSAVYAVYEDKESRIWLGTLRGGINLADPNKNRFQVVARDPREKEGLSSNFILSFYEAPGGKVWIGTDGYGVDLWDRAAGTFGHFHHDAADPRSLDNDFVPCVRGDYRGDVWVATYGGGVSRYDKGSHSFIRYPCFNESGTEERNAWTIFEDSRRDLWAGFVGDGRLFRLNRQTGRFELFDPSIVDVITIFEDRDGMLWVGTFNNLIRIDQVHHRNDVFSIDKPVRAVVEDGAGRFWVGTEGGGLLQVDKHSGRILRRFTEKDGLSNNTILNIIDEPRGALWISTFNGLNKFVPATGAFTRYYLGDGLQGNEFNYNAAARFSDGELAFGGINGFSLFYPDSVTIRSFTPPVFLTGLRVDNQPVDPAVFSEGASLGTLQLAYDKSTLSFDFSALEYSFPDNIVYAYYLEGLDKTWNYVGKSRTANYSRIHEGTYVLKLRSTDAAGHWGPETTALTIVVQPPWYRTWWAYLLYGVLLVSGIYTFLHYRHRQARLKYELDLSVLRAEKEKEVADKEREIHEKRLSFFTDISHEFRTPLTLIINPISDLIKRDQTEGGENATELDTVRRNARRLLKLVDQLLLLRKAERETDTLRVTRLDFRALCHDVYLYFSQQAKASHIDYRFEATPATLFVFADYEKIETVLYNLLSNALKFTPPGGRIVLSLKTAPEQVEVTVSDTGPGIPPETGERLFERFYQGKYPGKQSGFGIGLYLVRHFIEEHGGMVRYESNPGEGTSFIFSLPLDQPQATEDATDDVSGAAPNDTPKDLEEAPPPARYAPPPTTGFVSNATSLLVVDDDPEIRSYIRQIFSDDYIVYEAADAASAIDIVRKELPSIVISDIRMNGREDGIELCRWIKEDEALSHIPVILLTASPVAELKLKGTELGSDDYMTKPFEKDLLKARVSGLLKNRSHLQRYFYNEITLQHNPLQVSEDEREFLNHCIRIVEENLEDDQFTIRKLSEGMRMSHSNLYKRVKAISGLTVNAFVRQIKLRKSAGMLIDSDLNINEIAVHSGFNDVKYFREQFARLFGLSPSKYRQKYRKPFQKNYKIHPGQGG